MRFLLDTNAVIALLKNPRGPIRAQISRHQPQDIGVSALVSHELFYGAYRSSRVADNLVRLDALQFEVLAFDQEDAREAGAVRAALSQQGTPIGPYDVLIAGQARCRDLVLVTRNLREFERVPGLRVECWE